MSEKTMVLIPYWVANRLETKNLPLSVCLDYKKMREIFPLDELSIFNAFQEYKFGQFSKLVDQWAYLDWYEQIKDDPDLITEHRSVTDLNESQWNSVGTDDRKLYNDIKQRTTDRLTISKVDRELIEPNCYSIVDFDINKYALIIKPGFLEATENISTVFDLVKDLLKISYMYSPVHTVSNTSVFRAYVKLLSMKVTGLL